MRAFVAFVVIHVGRTLQNDSRSVAVFANAGAAIRRERAGVQIRDGFGVTSLMLFIACVRTARYGAVKFTFTANIKRNRGMRELECCVNCFRNARACVFADDDSIDDDEEFFGLQDFFAGEQIRQ